MGRGKGQTDNNVSSKNTIQSIKQKPLLLLDVDGVLSPLTEPEGYKLEKVGFQMAFHPDFKIWSDFFQKNFELIWATSWMEEANTSLNKITGFPKLEVIRFDQKINNQYYQENETNTGKFPFVKNFLNQHQKRAVVWCEDDLGPEAFAWAKERNKTARTLLIKPDRDIGLTNEDIEKMKGFLKILK